MLRPLNLSVGFFCEEAVLEELTEDGCHSNSFMGRDGEFGVFEDTGCENADETRLDIGKTGQVIDSRLDFGDDGAEESLNLLCGRGILYTR
jgi:hypothetical protein